MSKALDPTIAEKRRLEMVDRQIASRQIHDVKILEAMRSVPRHLFVSEDLQDMAYSDRALGIDEGQTISQPFIVALMLAMADLKSHHRVLEIGTGSGYSAAVLSRIVERVYSVERHEALAREAVSRFRDLHYTNINVKMGDGSIGWVEHAPYDAILVTASGPKIPAELKNQLAVKARLVMPVGAIGREQKLIMVTRVSEDGFESQVGDGVTFVPLIGKSGWTAEQS